MRRIVIGIVLLFVVAGVLATYSFLLCAIFAIACLVVLAVKHTKSGALQGTLLLALAAVLASVWVAGRTPEHQGDRSSAESRLPLVGASLSAVPPSYRAADTTPQLDELQQSKDALRAAIQRLRKQSNTVERALEVKDGANAVIDYGRSQNRPIKELTDAKEGIDKAVRDLGLTSDTYPAFRDGIEKLVQSAELAMRDAADAKTLSNLMFRLRLDAVNRSADSVNDQMLRLEAAIDAFERDAADADLSRVVSNALTFDESGDRIVREQIVGIASRGAIVREIDASELMSDPDPEMLGSSLAVSFGADRSTGRAVTDPSHIPIRPGIEQITLIKRTVVPAHRQDLPSALRLVRFHYVAFKWPIPLPMKLRLTLDLSGKGGPAAVPFSFEIPANSPIAQIRLPADALFASSIAVGPAQREGATDVLRPTEALLPSYFQTHENAWIELMPESPVFRNSLVQGHKEQLFPENLTASLIVAGIGLLIAWIFA